MEDRLSELMAKLDSMRDAQIKLQNKLSSVQKGEVPGDGGTGAAEGAGSEGAAGGSGDGQGSADSSAASHR